MNHVYVDAVRAEIAFAEAAAQHFADHPEHWSYSDGEIEPGSLLALRWGLGKDCVLIVKLDMMSHTPTLYAQLIRAFESKPQEKK